MADTMTAEEMLHRLDNIRQVLAAKGHPRSAVDLTARCASYGRTWSVHAILIGNAKTATGSIWKSDFPSVDAALSWLEHETARLNVPFDAAACASWFTQEVA